MKGSKNEDVAQDHSCNLNPLVTNSLGKTVKVPTRCTLAVKHLNILAGMPYSANPHTAQEKSAQPIVQRQVMSQYHLSPTSRRRVEGSVEEQEWGQVMS